MDQCTIDPRTYSIPVLDLILILTHALLSFHGPSDAVLTELGIASFVSVPVVHCEDSHGVVLRFHSGWSVAYSGDTRPTPVRYPGLLLAVLTLVVL